MTEREAAAASARPDLHAAIMNLPDRIAPDAKDDSFMRGYRFGHRAARHAAAELVLADRAASAPQAVRRLTKDEVTPLMQNDKQAMARSIQRKFCEVNGIVPLAPQDTGEA